MPNREPGPLVLSHSCCANRISALVRVGTHGERVVCCFVYITGPICDPSPGARCLQGELGYLRSSIGLTRGEDLLLFLGTTHFVRETRNTCLTLSRRVARSRDAKDTILRKRLTRLPSRLFQASRKLRGRQAVEVPSRKDTRHS